MLAQTPASDTTGQSGDVNRSAAGDSMYGILVASGCNSSSMNGAWSGGDQQRWSGSNKSSDASSPTAMNRSTNAAAGGDLNKPETGSANRTEGSTTGDTSAKDTAASNQSVDQSGSMPRGTQPGDMNRSTVGDRSVNSPQTGMADRERVGDTSATTGSQMVDRNYAGQELQSGASNTGQWDKACFISPTTTSFVFLTKDGRQVKLDDASNSLVQQRISSTNRVSQKNKIFRVRVTGDLTGDTLHITDIQI
jgi:hypothetical protein